MCRYNRLFRNFHGETSGAYGTGTDMVQLQDAAGLYCAQVKVPSFTKGKPQLSKYEVDTTRELARVCMYTC